MKSFRRYNMKKEKKEDCEKIAIKKLKGLMGRNKFMWRSNLVKLLANELSIEEGNASELVDSLEERKLIGYTGELTEVTPKIMARQVVITRQGEEIIRSGNIPGMY